MEYPLEYGQLISSEGKRQMMGNDTEANGTNSKCHLENQGGQFGSLAKLVFMT